MKRCRVDAGAARLVVGTGDVETVGELAAKVGRALGRGLGCWEVGGVA